LLDHWRSAEHQTERLVLIKKLLDFAHKNKTRITLISGDVHIGAVGCLVDKRHSKETNTASINSLITSAVVNAPPPSTAIDLLEVNAGVMEDVDSHIKAGLVSFPPEKKEMYLRGRNFLELIGTESRGFIAKWQSEEALHKSYSFYIRPPTEGAKPDLKIVNQAPLSVTLKLAGQTVTNWFH